MLAKVGAYGGNAVRYAMEKEKAKVVKVNHLPEGLDATSIWYRMKHHCQLHQQDRTVGRKLERFMVSFVLSPSKEESKDFTMQDWADLQNESLEVLDSVGLLSKGFTEEVKTNFHGSMNVGALHSDSKSGTLHLHVDCCRVDLDGSTNDVHDIHKRAMMAAEIINMRHGWKQPQEIRDMRQQEIAEFCEYTLRNMERFDTDYYFKLLRMKGYEITPKYAKQKKLVGYTIGKNASVFKVSAIGRKFMASRLENTWRKLHPQSVQSRLRPAIPVNTFVAKPVRPVVPKTTTTQPRVQPTPFVLPPKPTPTNAVYDIKVGDETFKVEIPDAIKDLFINDAQVPEDNDLATIKDVSRVAMLLFVGYIDAATSMSESCGGGGGSAPSSGWGKDNDEDERQYARRCLKMAHSMCKPKPRRRGYHR
ncbi:relaxase/mobilization nuclease domain-containing protein [Prevotella aurantiaca JCM 15754]